MAWRRGFSLVLLVAGACAAGEEGSSPSAGAHGKADYYGTDDRQQIRDSQHPQALTWARATAIVVNQAVLFDTGTGMLAANVATHGQKAALCAGERFADEPALGFCSAFLVAPDLVATAGHCFKARLCDEMAFVFDYYAGGASEDVGAIPAANVYACADVVAQEWGDGLDYALVRLDRPTTNRTPFALQSTPPPVDGRVALIGYPSGILAKIDVAGRVLRHEGTDGSRIRTSVDSFPGHSGGVMIDLATGAAFAVHVEGSSPSFVSAGTCNQVAACTEVTLDDDGLCDGAVETSVAAFSGCCDGASPPPPAPTGTSDACLPSGAPCDADRDCANAMCACASETVVSESFVVPGACTMSSCADQRALCEQACAEMDFLGIDFTLSWWTATCAAD